MDNIRVMICEVGKEPYVKEIPNELKAIHEIVGENIETTPLTSDGLYIIYNGEGILSDLPFNENLGVNILGNFVVSRSDGEELVSITDKDIEVLNLIQLLYKD